MNKKTKIIIVCCVAAVIVIAGGVWYMVANQGQSETPNNAKSVSSVTDAPDAVSAPDAAEKSEKPAEKTEQKPDTTTTQKPAETKVPVKVKPTFMYFVTNTDMQNTDTKNAIEDLKKEYGDSVVFDIKNIEEDPTILDNFSLVEGQTPALIMLNTKNEICQFLFKTNDKTQLKAAIDGALQG